MAKQRGKQIWIAIRILFISIISSFGGCVCANIPHIKIFDLIILDNAMLIKGGIEADDNIVLVNIDPASKREMGRAPGPEWRKYHPIIMEQLREAKIIAFDLYFDGKTGYDKKLAEKMKEVGNVIIGTHKDAEIPKSIISNSKPGYLYVHKDLDDKVRRLELIRRKTGKEEVKKGARIIHYYYQPSFLFRILHTFFDVEYQESDYGEKIYGVEEERKTLKISVVRKIPRDNDKMMYIRHIGEDEEFTELSYHDVYTKSYNPAQVRKKIVIIGSTAQPIDRHNTPYGRKHGIMLNALALNTILKDAYVRHVSGYWYIAILFASSLLLATFKIWYTRTKRIILFGVLIALTLILTYLCYWTQTIPLIATLIITYLLLFLFSKIWPELEQPEEVKIDLVGLFALLYLTCFFAIGLATGQKDIIIALFPSLGATAVWYLIMKHLEKKKERKSLKGRTR